MELMHDCTFRVTDGPHAGLYRAVVVDANGHQVAAARLDPEERQEGHKTGRPRKASRKRTVKAPKGLVTKLTWFSFDEIDLLRSARHLSVVEVKLPARFFQPLPQKHKKLFKDHLRTMRSFLNPRHLERRILKDHGWSGLVREARLRAGASRYVVYKLASSLCRYGFQVRSLRPDFCNCGAPGVRRPVDPGGRRKAGRKTREERIAIRTGRPPPKNVQPGMSTDWTERVLAADAGIPSPKPRMSARVAMILHSQFVSSFEERDGKFIEVLAPKGQCPNAQQIARVLETAHSALKRLIQATTKGHFQRAMRGLKGKSWKGVAGPGHTWAIDSTVGDVYLRSSVNRAWILGRPVVYVVVDVWSTAVVGFYVCLSGPSWSMASVAVFNSCAPVPLMSELWGFDAMLPLSPRPTLCAVLFCDRGEYLSKAASNASLQALLSMSYSPPYRPDYHGMVEVLHRIQKDEQFFIVPGAIDARREEYELRNFDPARGALTIGEFVQYLYVLFTKYNLSADRRHRLDPHMIAAGVHPSPAGLWHWGHEVGIGFQRHTSDDELIQTWLPTESGAGRVTKDGVQFAGRLYEPAGGATDDWTARARNFGGWNIDVTPYPGSVARIWTPSHCGEGLLSLKLSEQSTAARELTLEEVADAYAVEQCNLPALNYDKLHVAVQADQAAKAIVNKAVKLTAEADGAHKGPKPTITEARAIERKAPHKASAPSHTNVPRRAKSESQTDAEATYQEMMRGLLSAANKEKGHGQSRKAGVR